jgi:hypothetical protein
VEYLKRLALWFVTGIGLALGATLVVWFAAKLETPQRKPIRELIPVKDQRVAELSQVSITEHLVVSGMLLNDSDRTPKIDLELQLFKESKLLYRCNGSETLKPNPRKSMRFQIDCREIRTKDVPPGIEFQIQLREIQE